MFMSVSVTVFHVSLFLIIDFIREFRYDAVEFIDKYTDDQKNRRLLQMHAFGGGDVSFDLE